MAIFLSILKIIGIVIVVLLGILIVVILCVLFIPVRYRITGEIDEEIHIRGKVHWFLHLISAVFEYEDQKMDFYLRILGFRKSFLQQEDDNGKDTQDGASSPEVTQESTETETESDSTHTEEAVPDADISYHSSDMNEAAPDGETSQHSSGMNGEVEDSHHSFSTNEETQTVENAPSVFSQIKDKVHGFIKKIQDFFRKIKNLFRQAKETVSFIYQFLTDESNQRIIPKIFSKLKKLLRHCRFRKLECEMNFSLGDPAVTGQVLGILCVIPLLYQYQVHLYPDFESEKPYLRGSFDIKGYIRLNHVAALVISLLLDKDFRRLLKLLLK